jgi:hypothetical protein
MYMYMCRYGLTALLPDYMLLCCACGGGAALDRVSREHLSVALALHIPTVLVITKVCVHCHFHRPPSLACVLVFILIIIVTLPAQASQACILMVTSMRSLTPCWGSYGTHAGQVQVPFSFIAQLCVSCVGCPTCLFMRACACAVMHTCCHAYHCTQTDTAEQGQVEGVVSGVRALLAAAWSCLTDIRPGDNSLSQQAAHSVEVRSSVIRLISSWNCQPALPIVVC